MTSKAASHPLQDDGPGYPDWFGLTSAHATAAEIQYMYHTHLFIGLQLSLVLVTRGFKGSKVQEFKGWEKLSLRDP